jgi:predicted alpha/beta hydrolase family esterase
MPPKKKSSRDRVLDARPDTLDFRDLMFTPTLVEVPTEIPLPAYLKYRVPILDQGTEGACTGFGLATVANYLLRCRKVVPSKVCVSAHMLYDLARRYDEWPGVDYSGSSARGAMKGWHKHGACLDSNWTKDRAMDAEADWGGRWTDARKRPLGAYFRVNHRDLVAMHSAIAEVGILYATATVHSGWDGVGADGLIPWEQRRTGGHAFAIVAYDEQGFWIQNSWGPDWGRKGFAQVSYDDWLENATDVWVARLGAPVELRSEGAAQVAIAMSSGGSRAYVFDQLRPHIVSLGNDGRLRPGGPYGTDLGDVTEIVQQEYPRITQEWTRPHLLLYAHGGLVSEETAIQRVADYHEPLIASQVYPLAFVWKTDYWTTITNILDDALSRRRPEGILDAAKDFMLDRLDDALEPIARIFTGKASWDEMKENARLASTGDEGGAAIVAGLVRRMVASAGKAPKIHLVGHSAGSIFLAHLLERLTAPADDGAAAVRVETCTLWAPACTMRLFKERYAPAARDGRIRSLAIFTLTDEAERDDHCANIYHKSLLYLVSNAFEKKVRVPIVTGDSSGEPLLGLERSVTRDSTVQGLIKRGQLDWVRSPNQDKLGTSAASRATHHGEFDDDEATVRATLARILGRGQVTESIRFGSTGAGKRARRELLMQSARG